MSKLDRERLDELEKRYPSDSCRQIATYVLEDFGAPEDDRVCAAGILGALDAADHAMDLTILEINQMMLLEAARCDADRLWSKYDEDGEYTEIAGSRLQIAIQRSLQTTEPGIEAGSARCCAAPVTS